MTKYQMQQLTIFIRFIKLKTLLGHYTMTNIALKEKFQKIFILLISSKLILRSYFTLLLLLWSMQPRKKDKQAAIPETENNRKN